MARYPRLEFEGALYHVLTRGNQRQRVFQDERDREKYLLLLANYGPQYAFHLYAYALMSNHVHLLIETGAVPLSRIMQRLGSAYTQYFNQRHHQVGHLFQGRYKALLCQKGPYLLELTRYIHLNPVRAKLVEDPGDYRWSSYGVYVGQRREAFVETRPILEQFGKGEGAKAAYRRFVMEGISQGHQEKYYEAREGRLLGDEGFIEEIKRREGKEVSLRIKVRPEELVKVVAAEMRKEEKEIVGTGKGRGRVRGRELVAYVGREYGGCTTKELAAILKVDPTCVSRCVTRVSEQMSKGSETSQTLSQSIRMIVTRLRNIKYHA